MKPTINTANNLQSLTPNQLQELHGVLKNPISGRQIMIPVTSKAFVLGTLRPLKNADDEEVVLVRQAGADLKEMPRKAVCDYLLQEKQRKQDQGKKKKEKPEPSKEESTAESASKVSGSGASSGSTNASPSLPYFEIKEELDSAGKVVRSEAVNVTKQLELVTKHVNGSDGESKEPEPKDSTSAEDGLGQADFDVETYTYENDTKTTMVTDQEYKALSDRLEELARMEEEAEAESANNALSALRLQSTGWSKGFLGGGKKSPTSSRSTQTQAHRANPKPKQRPSTQQPPTEQLASEPPEPVNKPKPKPKPKPQSVNPIPSQPKEKKQTGGWSKGFLNSNNAAKTTIATEKPKPPPPTEERQAYDQSSKKVSFQSKMMEEVREIPRIGQTSVSTLKKPPPTALDAGPGPARPFDRNVFSGVVKERPIGQQSSSRTEKPRTRISKFAQERMEMENR